MHFNSLNIDQKNVWMNSFNWELLAVITRWTVVSWVEFLTREHLGSVLADQISTCETAEQSKILPSCPESETNEGACYLCPCPVDQIETDREKRRTDEKEIWPGHRSMRGPARHCEERWAEHGSVPQLVVQEHMGWEVDSWTDFGSLQSEMWKQCIIQCWNLEQTMKQWNCFNFNLFKSWNNMKNRSQSFWEMKNENVSRLNRVKSYWKPKSTGMQILVLYFVNKPTNRPNVNRETDSSRVL